MRKTQQGNQIRRKLPCLFTWRSSRRMEVRRLDDFGNRLTKSVWYNWLMVMPESAMLGDKGQATIRFQIDKDSSHPATAPTIELSSGKKPLDAAALRAVRDSIKSLHLPHTVAASSIEFRVLFFYNQQPDKLRSDIGGFAGELGGDVGVD